MNLGDNAIQTMESDQKKKRRNYGLNLEEWKHWGWIGKRNIRKTMLTWKFTNLKWASRGALVMDHGVYVEYIPLQRSELRSLGLRDARIENSSFFLKMYADTNKEKLLVIRQCPHFRSMWSNFMKCQCCIMITLNPHTVF